jgi:hypothetical protein
MGNVAGRVLAVEVLYCDELWAKSTLPYRNTQASGTIIGTPRGSDRTL